MERGQEQVRWVFFFLRYYIINQVVLRVGKVLRERCLGKASLRRFHLGPEERVKLPS